MADGNEQQQNGVAQQGETAAEKWWNSVQEALNAEECELDLSDPEDAAFLVVTDYEKVRPGFYDVIERYALDPQKRPIDLAEITPEEMVARQETADVSYETKVYLYEKAQQGRLFLRSNSAARKKRGNRQLLVGEDGRAKLGNDIDHLTPDEDQILHFLEEPEKPTEPDAATKEKAAAGDEAAQDKLLAYESTMRTYESQMADWARTQELAARDPQLYAINSSFGIVVSNYFTAGIEYGDALTDYTDKLAALHKQAGFRKLPEEIRAIEINKDRQQAAFTDNLDGFAYMWGNGRKPKDGSWQPDHVKYIAGIFFSEKELRRGQKALEEGKGAEFHVLSAEETKDAVAEYIASSEFRLIRETLTRKDLEQIFDKERKPAEIKEMVHALYQNTLDKSAAAKAKWWDDLQKTLNDAGYETDLSNPRDLAGLLTFDVERTEPGVFNTVAHYAADPEQRPIDIASITGREILERQKTGVPDDSTFLRIRQAAEEGRLYIHACRKGTDRLEPCAVLLGTDGSPKIEAETEELAAQKAAATEVLDEPVRPAEPGVLVKILAFLHIGSARQTMRDYERNLQNYTNRTAVWESIQQKDQKFVTQARNENVISQNFFQNRDMGIEMNNYATKIVRLHEQAETEKMPEEKRRVKQNAEKCGDEIMQVIETAFGKEKEAGLIKRKEPLSEQNAYLLSRLLVSRGEILRAEKALQEGKESEYQPKTEQELLREQRALYGSDDFKRLCTQASGETLLSLIDASRNGDRAVCRFLDRLCADAKAPAQPQPDAGVPVAGVPGVSNVKTGDAEAIPMQKK